MTHFTKQSLAQDFLNAVLTTEEVESAGKDSHEGWLKTKDPELRTEKNPSGIFLGLGAKRVRVRDLSPKERQDLNIPDDANGGSDVYHNLYRPWSELDSDTRNKNVPPMGVLCYGLGDFLLEDDATVADLGEALRRLLSGEDASGIKLLSKINHVAFQCGELRVGSRGYGPDARDDFPLFKSLKKKVQELDEYTLLPAAKCLLDKIRLLND